MKFSEIPQGVEFTVMRIGVKGDLPLSPGMPYYGRNFKKISDEKAVDCDNNDEVVLRSWTPVAPISQNSEPNQGRGQGQGQGQGQGNDPQQSSVTMAMCGMPEVPEEEPTSYMRCQDCGSNLRAKHPEDNGHITCGRCMYGSVEPMNWNNYQMGERRSYQRDLVESMASAGVFVYDLDPSYIWAKADQIISHEFGNAIETPPDPDENPINCGDDSESELAEGLRQFFCPQDSSVKEEEDDDDGEEEEDESTQD